MNNTIATKTADNVAYYISSSFHACVYGIGMFVVSSSEDHSRDDLKTYVSGMNRPPFLPLSPRSIDHWELATDERHRYRTTQRHIPREREKMRVRVCVVSLPPWVLWVNIMHRGDRGMAEHESIW